MQKKLFQFKNLIMLVCVIAPCFLHAQYSIQELKERIKNELDSARMGSRRTHDYQFTKENAKEIFQFLKSFESDSNDDVRERVRTLKSEIFLPSSDLTVRQAIVEDFIKDGLAGDEANFQYDLNRLFGFAKPSDFSDKAKKDMIALIRRPDYHENLILLCGIAQIKELIPDLKRLSAGFDRTKKEWYSTTAWYASLALARMGSKEKMDTLITAVELESDPTLRVIRLLPFLAYTKQHDAILLLRKYLESDEAFKGTYDTPYMPYNQYALEFLATYIDEFPVKKRYVGYTGAELQIARSFLRKNYN